MAFTVQAGGGPPSDGLSPAARLIERLERCKPTGAGKWMACCPAHQDRTPSLSIKEEDDGRLLIHCFAGCASADVVSAVGLALGDLFPDDPTWTPGPRVNGSAPQRSVQEAGYVLDIAQGIVDGGGELSESELKEVARATDTLLRAGVKPQWQPAAPDRAFAWIPANQWLESMRAPDWILHGLLERGTLNVNVGGWGAGKSAIELDRALRIVHEMPVHGVQPAPGGLWVYVVGEAQRGFQRRVAAWHAHNERDPTARLVIIPEAVLIGQPDHEAALAVTLRQIESHYGCPIAGVTLDTLARCFGLNDESSNSDVSRWVNSIQQNIIAPTGAAVVVLHHPGHGNKDRGRGASALPGATDVEWLVTIEGFTVVMRCTKNKDGAPCEPMAWEIGSMSITIDGEAVTAPVVTETDVPSDPKEGLKEGSKQAQAVDVLVAMWSEARDNLEAAGRPVHEALVERRGWRDRLEEDGIISAKNPRQAFNRMAQELSDKGAITLDGEIVYPGRQRVTLRFGDVEV